jgi:hypothetical protein
MPVLYVPTDLPNPARNRAQKQVLADLLNEGWVSDGTLFLKDGLGTVIKVMILRKED